MTKSNPIQAPALWSDRDLENSLNHFLTPWDSQSPIWVFTYGSLIWQPDFPYTHQYNANLQGYHRSLCLWSRLYRGTPDYPGLVFGLDQGGQCEGVAYCIDASQVIPSLQMLWKREMQTGDYEAQWLNCQTPIGEIQTLAFVMNRQSVAYATDLCLQQKQHIIQTASGTKGPCIDYVVQTAYALKQHNIYDPDLESLVAALTI